MELYLSPPNVPSWFVIWWTSPLSSYHITYISIWHTVELHEPAADHVCCLCMSISWKGDIWVSAKHAEMPHTRCIERPIFLCIIPSHGNNRNSCCQDFDILLYGADTLGQRHIRCTSENGQCPARYWHHFNIARNYPHIFLLPVSTPEKSTGVKKHRNYLHKYNVLIQCELFYCDYICGF